MKTQTYKISIVGTGNVATHLAIAFFKSGIPIGQIITRNQKNAIALANECDALISDFDNIDFKVDAIFLCVKDDCITSYADSFSGYNGVLIHCSGSVPLSALVPCSLIGVVYPFVSMKKGASVDFSKVYFYIEGNTPASHEVVFFLAKKLTNDVQDLNSEQRATLHLAAVFAQNFVNHLMVLSSDLLVAQGLSFDALRPLLNVYFEKLSVLPPHSLQTGPAIRKDKFVIAKHLKILKSDNELQNLYKTFTKQIQHKND